MLIYFELFKGVVYAKKLLFSSWEICCTVMAETLLRQMMREDTSITFYSSGILNNKIAEKEFDLLQLRKPS